MLNFQTEVRSCLHFSLPLSNFSHSFFFFHVSLLVYPLSSSSSLPLSFQFENWNCIFSGIFFLFLTWFLLSFPCKSFLSLTQQHPLSFLFEEGHQLPRESPDVLKKNVAENALEERYFKISYKTIYWNDNLYLEILMLSTYYILILNKISEYATVVGYLRSLGKGTSPMYFFFFFFKSW